MNDNKKPLVKASGIDVNSNSLIVAQNENNINILENKNWNCARTGNNWFMKSYSWNDIVGKLSAVVKTAETLDQYHSWKTSARMYTKEDMARYGKLSREQRQGEQFAGDEFKRLTEKRETSNNLKNKASSAKDKGGFIAGIFSENKRQEALLESRTMLTIDIDGYKGNNLIQKLESIIKVKAVIYSTHSHNPSLGSYNLRLVVPFDRAVSKDEYKWLSRKFTDIHLVEDGKSMVDPASFKPNQIMFYPSTPKDGEFYFKEFDYDFIKVDSYLEGNDIYNLDLFIWDETEKKAIINKPERNTKKTNSCKTHPYLLSGLAGDFCRIIGDIENCIKLYFPGDFEVSKTGRLTNNSVASTGSMALYNESQFIMDFDTTNAFNHINMNAFDMLKYYKCDANVQVAFAFLESDKYFNHAMYKVCEELQSDKEIDFDDYILNSAKSIGVILRYFMNDDNYYFKYVHLDQFCYYIRVSKNRNGLYKNVNVFYEFELDPGLIDSLKDAFKSISITGERNFEVLKELIKKGNSIKRGNYFNVNGERVHHDILIKNTPVFAGTGIGKTHEVAKYIVKHLGNPEIIIASTKNNTNVDDLEKEISKVIELYIDDKSEDLLEWLENGNLSQIGIYTLSRTGNLAFSQKPAKRNEKLNDINAVITNNSYFGFVGDKAEYNNNMKILLECPRKKIMIYDEYESLEKDNLMKIMQLNSYMGKTLDINGNLKQTLMSDCLKRYASDAARDKEDFLELGNPNVGYEFAEINYLMENIVKECVFEYIPSISKGENLKATFDEMTTLVSSDIIEDALSDDIPVKEGSDIFFNLGLQLKRYSVNKDDDSEGKTNFRKMLNKQECVITQNYIIVFNKKDDITEVTSVEELASYIEENKIDIESFKTLVRSLCHFTIAKSLFTEILEMKIPSIVDLYESTIKESYYLSANKLDTDMVMDDTLEFVTDENIKDITVFGIQSDNPDEVILDLMKYTSIMQNELFVVIGNMSNCTRLSKKHLPHVQYRGNMSDDGMNKNTQLSKLDNVDSTMVTTITTYINSTECQGRNLSNSEGIICPLSFGVNSRGRGYWNSRTKKIEVYSKLAMTKKIVRQTIGRILRTNRKCPIKHKIFLFVGNLGIHNPEGPKSKTYKPVYTVFEDVLSDLNRFDWNVNFEANNIYNKSYRKGAKETKSGFIIVNYLKSLLDNVNQDCRNDLDSLHFNNDVRKENGSVKKVDVGDIESYYERTYKILESKLGKVRIADVDKKVCSKFKIGLATLKRYKKEFKGAD